MGKTFEIKKRLYMCDTDASGIAYHSKYLEWMEMARVEMLNHIYKSQTKVFTEDKIAFVPVHIDIRYKTPLYFEDEVSIKVKVEELKKIKAVLSYELTIEKDGKQLPVSNASVDIVCVDAETKRPTSIPSKLVDAIKNWEKQS
jgi:tol-pal system-associated acyl-CoA thioesterase